jgi:DNA-binding CsgD family transcriptional regulator
MGLYLRSRELHAIGTIADALAAPLAFDGVRSWALDVGERVRDLFGGEAGLVYGSAFEAPGVWSADLPAHVQQSLADYHAHAEPELHSHNPVWNAALEQRRAERLDVYTMANLRRALSDVRLRLEDQPLYQEAMEPSRMLHVHGMAHASGSGETHVVAMSSREDRWRFGSDTPDVARLLLPALRAGCGILARSGMPPDDPRRPAGSLPDATAVFDHDGKRLLDASSALARIADATGAGELLVDAIRGTARAVAASERTRPEPDIRSSRTSIRRLRLPSADVEIIATRLGTAHASAADVVLVTVHCTAAWLPSRAKLVERFGLTPREADVALLLARGLTRALIAERLGLSAHTVRHHTEGVFRKLAVNTRSAVAVALLHGGND